MAQNETSNRGNKKYRQVQQRRMKSKSERCFETGIIVRCENTRRYGAVQQQHTVQINEIRALFAGNCILVYSFKTSHFFPRTGEPILVPL